MTNHGRYVMLRKIADGGMAEIFLARQTGEEGFSRLVIVKRILPAFSSDPHFRDMLLDEAHIAMSLNHNNVVPVLDLGRGEGSYFLVMDLVDGWDLEQVFLRAQNAGFPLPLGLSLYVAAEVCRGLGYAHGKRDADGRPLSIIHRDISPQNILISEHGEVKVTDFGIAKALGRRDRTQQGVIKGKLDFMSPEQASGTPLHASSDIFATGSVLYLLCTGQRPFASPSDMESLVRVQRANFVPPERLRPDMPPSVARIITQAMRVNPADRYASAEDMMFDIEAVIRDEFGSPGQSQLRQWLAELSALDGAAPISRAQPANAAPSLTSRWFAEGEMLSFDDSSSIGISPRARDLAWEGAPSVRAPTPSPLPALAARSPSPASLPVLAHPAPPAPAGFASFAAVQPQVPAPAGYQYVPVHMPLPVHMASPGQPQVQAFPLAAGAVASPIVWDAPGNANTFSPQQSRRLLGRRGGTRAQRGRSGWATPAFRSSGELPQKRSGGWLRGFAVLMILIAAGGFVASQVMSPAQQATAISEARALWARGQTEVMGFIDRVKAPRDPLAPAVGLERAPAK